MNFRIGLTVACLLSVASVLSVGQAASQQQGGANDAGLRIAAKRGYTGAKGACFAKVFASHASLRPGPNTGRPIWSAPASRAYKGELFSQCGISR